MDLTLYLYAIPFFLLTMLIEFSYGVYKKKNTYNSEDAICSISTGMLMMLTNMLSKGLLLASYLFVFENFALIKFEFKGNLLVLVVVFYFVVVDFLYYWFHRACHEINILWAVHQTHHSSEDYNLSTALRQSASQGFASHLFYLPLALLGCPPVIFFTLAGINTVYQYWVHTQHIDKLGWMEKILVTPSHHRVHHGQNPEYLDRNHGGIFIVWDKWFGTFEPENKTAVYGVTKPLRSFDPIWANFVGFHDLIEDSIMAKHWRDKLKLWFMPPGWRPDDLGGMMSYDLSVFEKYHAPKETWVRQFSWLVLFSLIALLMYLVNGYSELSGNEYWTYIVLIIVGLWALGIKNRAQSTNKTPAAHDNAV